jgi:hypothetical protein
MRQRTDQCTIQRSQPDPVGVTVRPLQPGGAGPIHAMHGRLSPEILYCRYVAKTNGALSEYPIALNAPQAYAAPAWEAQPAQRLMLSSGELYRVPACYRWLRVTAGIAYVTQAGQDHILHSGQEMQLERAADVALVSAIGCEHVVIKLFEPQN